MDGGARDTDTDSLERGELGGADGGDERTLPVAGTTAKERACHVAVITGRSHPWKHIHDDQLVRPERAGTALVWITGLIAACGNRVDGHRAGLETGDLDGKF